MSPAPRSLAAAATWLIGGFVITLLLAAAVPLALGMHSYTVRSGSMTPAIETGDIVVTREIAPAEASVGEIVTFKDPGGGGELITHRVRDTERRGDRVSFLTRGDANNTFERWNVAVDGTIGRVAYRLPMAGRALAPIASGPGRIGLVVVPALLLCALGLIRIWAPERVGA